jgi:DNA repair exonuclease SbcCD ATPase subunit
MDLDQTKFEVNLEYPVSIEAILSVSFNLEGFKSVFEFILQTLRRHESLFKSQSEKLQGLSNPSQVIEDLLSRLSSAETSIKSLNSSQIQTEKDVEALQDFRTDTEKFKETTDSRLSKLEGLESRLAELESLQELQKNDRAAWEELKRLVDAHEEALKEYSRFMDGFRSDIEGLTEKQEKNQKYAFESREKIEASNGKINDHEKRIHKLEMDMNQAFKAIQGLGGEFEQMSKPVEAPVQEVVVDNSKLDFLSDSLKDLLQKLSELEARLRAAEESSSKAKVTAERTENHLKTLENELRSLKSRQSAPSVPASDSKSASSSEIDHLRSLISNLESQLDSKLSSSDFQLSLSDLMQRLEDLASKMRALESALSKRALKSDLDELLRSMNSRVVSSSSDSFDASKLTSLSKRVGALEEALLKLAMPAGYDLVMVVNIILKMQQETKELKEKTDKSSRDTWQKLKELEELLNKKAGLDKLKELEDMLLAKLKEMYDEFIKRFADKNETKRALKYLEKLIRESETIKVVKDGEDAMLARKPLGGWSCASCQKDLEKLMGKIAPYHAWNKMPYRDPADRIARVGPGFSRMLATVQPDMLTGRGKGSINSPHVGVDEDESRAFPPVKKGNERPFTSL